MKRAKILSSPRKWGQIPKPVYTMPDKQMFLLDTEIGRFLLEIGDFKTEQQLMKHFGINEEVFRQRAQAVAKVLDANEIAEIRQALYEIGKENTSKPNERFRRQNRMLVKKMLERELEGKSNLKGKIGLVKRIIDYNSNLPPAQFQEKVIPLVKRILGKW